MPSGADALGLPTSWINVLGGWSPNPSAAYCRAARHRIGIIQGYIAKIAGSGRWALLGEAEERDRALEKLLSKEAGLFSFPLRAPIFSPRNSRDN